MYISRQLKKSPSDDSDIDEEHKISSDEWINFINNSEEIIWFHELYPDNENAEWYRDNYARFIKDDKEVFSLKFLRGRIHITFKRLNAITLYMFDEIATHFHAKVLVNPAREFDKAKILKARKTMEARGKKK